MSRLLRLSLSLWLALPSAAADPAPPADPALAKACAFDEALCRRGEGWAKRVREAGARSLVGPRLSQEELGTLRADIIDLANEIDKAAAKKKTALPEAFAAFKDLLDPPYESLDWMTKVAADRDLTALGEDMNALDGRLKALERDAARLRPGAEAEAKEPLIRRLDAVSADGGELWRRVEALSRNIDGLGRRIDNGAGPAGGIIQQLSAAGRLGERVNPFQSRVAELAGRSQRVALLLGAAPPALVGGKAAGSLERLEGRLADPFSAARRALPDEGPGPVGEPGPPALPSPMLPAAAPDLLEIRRAPAPVGRTWPAGRPLFTGGRGRDADPEDTAAVEALRAKGGTRTFGDPAGRAAYVFPQTGETCALAASAQILAEISGVKPEPKTMKRLEDQLYREAVRRGYFAGDNGSPRLRFTGTTPGQYVGALLGVPIRRTYLATTEQLDRAVQGGRMLLVATNTGKLWNDARFANGGHLVVVTGAEARKSDGTVLGYYINDTGTNEGGRFVPREQFLDAWNGNGRLLLEPQ